MLHMSSLVNRIAQQISRHVRLQATRNVSRLQVRLDEWWKLGVGIVDSMDPSPPYIISHHDSSFSTPHFLSTSFMDPALKSRVCLLCTLPPDHEIVKMFDIIFTRLASNPNQYEVLRLLLNISELTTDAGRHLLANISPFPIPYPTMVFLYHLCYITTRNRKHYSHRTKICFRLPTLSSWIHRLNHYSAPNANHPPPSDHVIIKKLDTIFTRLEMHPHKYELQSLILILVVQSLLSRCIRDPIQVVLWGILAHMCKSFSSSTKASDPHFNLLIIWKDKESCFGSALFRDLDDQTHRRGCH